MTYPPFHCVSSSSSQTWHTGPKSSRAETTTLALTGQEEKKEQISPGVSPLLTLIQTPDIPSYPVLWLKVVPGWKS